MVAQKSFWDIRRARLSGDPLTSLSLRHANMVRKPEIMARILRGESVSHFETERVRKGWQFGSHLGVTVSPIKDSTGRIIGASKVARDNTGREASGSTTPYRRERPHPGESGLGSCHATRSWRFRVTEKSKRADELAAIVEERTLAKVAELAFQVAEKGNGPMSCWRSSRNARSPTRSWHFKLRRKGKRANELAVINADLTRSKDALEQSNVELGQFAYIAFLTIFKPRCATLLDSCKLFKINYGGRLDAKTDGWINRIVESSGQMHTLIQDVLTYSRVDSREVPFKLVRRWPTFFDDSVVLLEASIQEVGGKVTCGELPFVMGDRSQLVQLAQNLIGNGLKYHSEKPPHIHVSARRDGGCWPVFRQPIMASASPRNITSEFSRYSSGCTISRNIRERALGWPFAAEWSIDTEGRFGPNREGEGHGSVALNFTMPLTDSRRNHERRITSH